MIYTDDWEYAAFPIQSTDTPSDMKGANDGPGLVDNDAAYNGIYPNLRKHIVENGFYMHRHYAASVCTPSRKQILSGRSVATQDNGEWFPIRPR